MNDDKRAKILWGVLAAAMACLWFAPPVAQDPAYHQFADSRALLGIPNALNVLSNLPLLLVGLTGLRLCWRKARDLLAPPESKGWLIFFASVSLTGLGSTIYHLQPSHGTLVFDRLPLASSAASLVAIVIGERISHRLYRRLLLPLLSFAVISVLYWYGTELQSHGDLRLYGFTQFFSIIFLLLVVRLYDAKWSHGFAYIEVVLIYSLAKACEAFDAEIFAVLQVVSGHTLKHFASASAIYVLIRMLRDRLPIGNYATLEYDR